MPLNLVLNIVIIPYLGIIGAAMTTALSYFLAMCIVGYFALREFTFNANIWFIFKSIISSIIMIVFILYIQPIDTFQFLLTISFAIIIYVISLVILKGFTKSEYDFAKNLLNEFLFSHN